MGISFIIFYALCFFLPNLVIDFLQYLHIKKERKKAPIILQRDEYFQAADYTLEKLRFGIVERFAEFFIFCFWVAFGLVWLNGLIDGLHLPGGKNLSYAIMILCFIFISQIMVLPFRYYAIMILDKNYGFNKQSDRMFFADLLKGALMTLMLGGIILYLLVAVVKNFEMWWLVGAIVTWLFIVGANFVYPNWIAPLFNRFTPLNDEGLENRIKELMHQVGFESSGVFVMDASKRDGRLNAYFGGLGKSKRVVLFDTLLDKISSDGLLAILAHELGHFYHRDVFKNLLIAGLFLFCAFFLVGHLPQMFFSDMGIEANGGNIVITLIMLAPLFSFWFFPVIGFCSRNAEYKADSFAVSLTSKRALAEALVRLVNENKSFPSSHWLYIFFHYTHPPLLERLRALDYEV